MTTKQLEAIKQYEQGVLMLDLKHGGEHMELASYYEPWFELVNLLAVAEIPQSEITRLGLEHWLDADAYNFEPDPNYKPSAEDKAERQRLLALLNGI